MLLQYPGTGSPIRKGGKATLTISATPGRRNEVRRGAARRNPCDGIHFTGVPHEARAIGATVASCREAKKLVRTAHGTLGGCEKGARCDVGPYTCTQSYFGGPRMSVQCESRKPANVPGPQAEVFWQWAGYDMNLGATSVSNKTTQGAAVVPQGRVPSPKPLRPGEGVFDRCQPGPQGGGYDVWIKSIPCAQARKWLLRLLPTFNLTDREGVGQQEQGWQCLTQSEGPRGPYHYVCARGPQLIVFAASP